MGAAAARGGTEARILTEGPSIVTTVNTEFENSPSRINLLREFPETRMGDRVLGPYRQGQDVELPLWIASHLVESGYAKFREEDQITLKVLHNVHYVEGLQPARQIARLPRPFYFMVRRLLKDLRLRKTIEPSSVSEFEKALGLSRDIVKIRVKKVVALAATGEQTMEMVSNLTAEEVALYDRLRKVVDDWKNDILGSGSSA